MRVGCIGEAMIELALHKDQPRLGVAGDTLNTAIYLHRSAPEIEVDYLTCLGDCNFSERIKTFIESEGVGTGKIRHIAGATPGLYAITTSPEGERSFTYWRDTSAARQLFEDEDFTGLASYDALYLSGISMAILPQRVRLALIDWLNGAAVRVIYDSNHRLRLWEDTETAQEITQSMWARADIALPSIDDEMALFGETAEEVTARFAALPVTGALKRGQDGPVSLGASVTQTYPRAQMVVDTTAAGDSFNGGYLGALLRGVSQAEALMAGHLLAMRVVQHSGAILPAS